jgi:hypothetical protein
MTYRFLAKDTPHPVHNVVRGQPGRLVDDQDTVHGIEQLGNRVIW